MSKCNKMYISGKKLTIHIYVYVVSCNVKRNSKLFKTNQQPVVEHPAHEMCDPYLLCQIFIFIKTFVVIE